MTISDARAKEIAVAIVESTQVARREGSAPVKGVAPQEITGLRDQIGSSNFAKLLSSARQNLDTNDTL